LPIIGLLIVHQQTPSVNNKKTPIKGV